MVDPPLVLKAVLEPQEWGDLAGSASGQVCEAVKWLVGLEVPRSEMTPDQEGRGPGRDLCRATTRTIDMDGDRTLHGWPTTRGTNELPANLTALDAVPDPVIGLFVYLNLDLVRD